MAENKEVVGWLSDISYKGGRDNERTGCDERVLHGYSHIKGPSWIANTCSRYREQADVA